MPRKKRMTTEQLTGVVEQNIQASSWGEADQGENYIRALNAYYGRDAGRATQDGLSHAQSMDVADMVEAVVAQMMPGFDFESIVEFDPLGSGDVDQARLESNVCNQYFRSHNNGYTVTQEAVRNALLLRNGIIKVAPEREVDTRTEPYKNLSALELESVETPNEPNQRVEITRQEPGDQEDTVNVTIQRTTEFARLNIESTDPTNFLVTKGYRHTSLRNAPFVGERYFLSRSDLLKRGYPEKLVKDLPVITMDTDSASVARNRDNQSPDWANNGDRSQDAIEVFELYMLVDFDGDGIAERRKVIYAGDASSGTILRQTPHQGVPYASGTGFLQPQRWAGMSLFDKLRSIEDVKTEALRLWLDNAAYANTAEVEAVEEQVNMEDLKARRPGGINRVTALGSVREIAISDNGPSLLALLEYQDKMRSERGGASLDLQSAELQLAGDTAHGVERQYSTKEQLAQLMTRTIAETLIRQTFLLIHETLREQFPDRAEVQVGQAQFVEYRPGTWRYRDRLTVVAGTSVAERAQRVLALEKTLAQQEKLIMSGFAGILVDLQTYYSTLLDWLAATGVQTPRRYWIDPRSPESLQAQQQKQQAQQVAAQQEQALSQQLFDSQRQIEQDKNTVDLVKQASQMRFDYWSETLKSEIDELRITMQYANGEQAEPALIDADQAAGREKAAGG